MSAPERLDDELVAAARAGDRDAVAELATRYLPLVYSMVGRAADSDLDVDDIVQETMVRVVTGLAGLRDGGRFRSWVVTIALRQLTDARGVARQARLSRAGRLTELVERPDPASDFVGLAMLRQALTREQREVAEATRWLDPAYRDLLSLWWLEVGGHLTRAEVATAAGTSVPHVAVRIQRMREQLDTSRRVVSALRAKPGCPELDTVTAGWDREPDPLWRKRIARHQQTCTGCADRDRQLVPPERLLAGLPLLVPPTMHPTAATTADAATADAAATATATAADTTTADTAAVGTNGAAGLWLTKLALPVVAAGLAVVVGLVACQPSPGTPGAAPSADPAAPAAPSSQPVATASVPGSTTGSASAPGAPAASAAPASPFLSALPALPTVTSARVTGTITQHARVAGRDNGQSTRYGQQSVWIFDDTTLKNPWGFLSNSGAVTRDLDAADGIQLTSNNPTTVDASRVPVTLIPHTQQERDFEARHATGTGCTAASDPYCGAVFAHWPGPVIADPTRGRVLIFYGKLCRGGAEGTPCSGALGKGLGTGVAALDMTSGAVTRLSAGNGPTVTGPEGVDRTMFFPDGGGYSSAALTVDGTAYVYGDCTYHGCHLAKVALAELTDRGRWTFWTARGTWSANQADGTDTIAAGAAGGTVFFNPALRAWMNVYLPYGTNDVMFQVGAAPFGPWSTARRAMTTPASQAHDYALFAHPEFAQQGGLVQYLSYFHPDTGEQKLIAVTFRR